MSYHIKWSNQPFSEIKEPIVVDFKENKQDLASNRKRLSGYDDDNPYLYSTVGYCLASKEAYYESEIGTFNFHLDAEGNAIINIFYALLSYVKLPSEIYDASGQLYKIKRVDAINGNNVLKGLWIPEGIEILGGMFAGSYSLLDVFFPNSLKRKHSIFWNTSQFEQNDGGRIWYPGSVDSWNALINDDSIFHTGDYTPYDEVVRFYDPGFDIRIPEIEVHTGKGKKAQCGNIRVCNIAGDMVIPSKWQTDQTELIITRVGRNAFAGNEKLTSITIPSSIRAIGKDAFYGCTVLEAITILEGIDDLIIEEGAFCNCTNLTKVEIRRNVSINDHVFACEEERGLNVFLNREDQLQVNGENTFYNRNVKITTQSKT